MQENEDPILVGRIGGVYGVRGWLKIESYTRPKENIFTYFPWLIHVDSSWKEVDIEEFQQRGNGRLLVKMTGIDTPEEAREYVHCELAVTQGKLPELSKGEYYWHDLIGLEVFNQDEINLGKVKNIVETGANDVLVIKKGGENKVKTLIPLVMDVFVKRVDLIGKTIHVDWLIEE
ncbi:MAG: 16S rRNA processing protein RimM [Gammaproteobacteria bacterium]|jgi:16S rRNA processing protein RimM